MKAKFSTLVFTLMAVFWIQLSTAQIITTAPDLNACPGTSVSVPIVVNSFSGVNSISLTLDVDPAVLYYTSFTNNSVLTGGFLVVNCQAPYNQVKAAWFGLSPVGLPDGSVLFTFTFDYLGGASPMSWDVATIGNCQYSDLGGNTIASNWVDGSVSPLAGNPGFEVQPVDQTVNVGEDAFFSAATVGSTSVLWQESTDGGSTWNDLADGGVYSGTATDNLIITSATLDMNGYQYQLTATEDLCNLSNTSSIVTLTVNQVSNDPIVQASIVSSCANNQVTIPVNVSHFNNVGQFSFDMTIDPASVTFSGLQNENAALAGASVVASSTGNNLSITWSSTTAANLGDGLLFELVFNYLGGVAVLDWTAGANMIYDINANMLNSTFLDGSINPLASAPQINSQPGNASIPAGANTSFSLTATNASDYQWQVSINGGVNWTDIINNANYSGANNSTLTLSNIPLSFNGYQYRCTVSESACNLFVVSASAVLTVNPATTDIVTTIGSIVTCPDAGGLVSVTIPVNVINFVDVASASMKISYDTLSLVFDTVVNVHPALTSGVFASNAADGQFGMAWFSIIPASFGSGTLFDLVFYYVANSTDLTFDLAPGICVYTDINFIEYPAQWVNGSVTLPGPEITTMPSNQVVFSGTNATFSLSGNNIDTYQWQQKVGANWVDLTNTGAYSGVLTNTMTITGVDISMDGNMYRCMVTGVCDPQYSIGVYLQVINATPINVSLPSLSQCQGPIVIPVAVTDFANVGSFSLTLNTTGNVLVYNGYQNMNPALSAGMMISNTTNSVTIAFNSTTPVSITNGNLVELKFNTNAGTTAMTWNATPGVNFFKSVGNTVLPSNFTSGSVTITPLPGPPATIQGPTTVCQGVLTTIFTTTGAANATSYLWNIIPANAGFINGTGTTATVTWDQFFSGLATITTQGVNACGNGITMSKSVTIIAVPTVSLSALANTCTGDSVVLTGGMPAGGTYSGTGVTNNVFYPGITGTGTFQITYTFGQSGCTASATQPITVYQTPTVALSMPSNLLIVSPYYPPYTLSGGSPIGGTYSGQGVTAATGIFNPGTAGQGTWPITYTYTTSDGCSASATQNILVDITQGIPAGQGNMAVSIQPNPSNGVFSILIQDAVEAYELSIFNDLGQVVYQTTLKPGQGLQSRDLDLSKQPKGLYFLKISGNQTTRFEKIVLN